MPTARKPRTDFLLPDGSEDVKNIKARWKARCLVRTNGSYALNGGQAKAKKMESKKIKKYDIQRR